MSNTVTISGKTTFAFDRIIRHAKAYLAKTHREYQMQFLPETYPHTPHQISHIDISVRGKMLKAHLEDTFVGIFSVKITRKTPPVMTILHDSLETDKITEIAKIYSDGMILVVTKSQGIPLMILQ
jgi:hypothetical protein